MNYFFKSTKRFSIIFTSLILVITLSAGSFAAVMNDPAPQPVAEEPDISVDSMDFEDIYGEIPEYESLPVEEMSFNMPLEMNGVYLVPGSDFIKSGSDSAEDAKKQIDSAIDDVIKAKMNTVIIDTVYGEKSIYITKDSPSQFADIDLVEYITEKCRENNLFVYAIFDASHYNGLEKLETNLSEFVQKHKLDGILIDGYEGTPDKAGYAEYIKSGGSMGFDNFKNQTAASIVKTASKVIRKSAADTNTQAGLLANPVWANISDNKDGSATKAEYTSLISGFADTKSYIELGWFDFVAVKADLRANDPDSPFSEIASWWGKLAGKKSIPMYFVYPSGKIGSNGWTDTSLAEQIALALNENAYRGAIFDSLKNVPGYEAGAVAAAPAKSETASTADMIKPLSTTASVSPPQETPTAYDNGGQADEELWEDYDDEDYDDSDDDSESAFSDGDVIKSISPMGVLTGEYGDDITITVVALKDSDVIATLNGETVFLSEDTGYKSSDANYGRFTGIYSVPDEDDDYDHDSGEMFLGALSVYASCDGRDEIFDGAYFATAKASGSTYPVQITADQARTYPTSTRDCVPIPTQYPQPKGAVDYAIGDPVTAKNADGVKFTHLILESGVRIDASDVKKVNKGPDKNSIKSLSLSEKSGYTYITFKTNQKVTYSVSYTGKEFAVTFNNTTSVPNSVSLKSNKIFSKAAWSGKNKLTLTLKKSGGFMGFKGYYDGDNLVFRFNNPPSSIKNTKIYVDPGHGASDVGNIGKNPTVYEKDINIAIAKKLVSELKSRGATVKMYDQSQGIRAPERVAEAEKWGADILVSIHCNSAANTSAKGTEVFYFYPFSQQLATASSLNTSKQLATTNRGPKPSYYNVTLSQQMASVLVETGFMTNTSDYKKLLKASYHQKIAAGVANGIEGAIKTAYTGTSSSGTEFTSPDDSSSSNDDEEDITSDSSETVTAQSAIDVSGVAFSAASYPYVEEDYVMIYPGKKYRIEILSDNGKVIRGSDFKWKSDNTKVATVDTNGIVTAKTVGDALITATNGNHTFECDIEVSKTSVKVSSISLSESSVVMVKKSTKTLKATVLPKNAMNTGVTWSSSNSKIASVDANGVITARNGGKATITAKAKSGSYKATCSVQVLNKAIKLEEISFDLDEFEMSVGDTDIVFIELYPDDTTDRDVTFTSSNSGVVSVDSEGNVTAHKKGTARITVTSKTNKRITATCKITVY